MGRKKNEEIEPTKEMFDLLKDSTEKTAEVVPETPKEVFPLIGSDEWTPFVLSKLKPDELYDGCPTYEGLRRICYDLLGTIVDTDIQVVQPPNVQNGNHSCVVAKMSIEHPIHFDWLRDVAGRTIRYSQVGDVFMGNGTKDLFAWRFSSATCWTRTKASLLRDIFRLRFVYTKEEMTELAEDQSGADGYMNINQVDALNSMTSRMDINTAKFIRGVWKKARPNDDTEDLNKVPFHIAIQCVGILNTWVADKDKIKPEVKGFDKNWKKELKCG